MRIFRKRKAPIVFAVELTEDNFPGLTTEQYEDIGSSVSSAVFEAVEKFGAVSLVSQGQFIPNDDNDEPIREPRPLSKTTKAMVQNLLADQAAEYLAKHGR